MIEATGRRLRAAAERVDPSHFLAAFGARAASVVSEAPVVVKHSADGTPLASLSSPSVVLAMLDLLSVEPGQSVLEVGTGTGYSTALLAELVGPSGSIISIEIEHDVAATAARSLAAYRNVEVVAGNGASMAFSPGTFDRIAVHACLRHVPANLVAALRVAGRIVFPALLSRCSGHLQLASAYSRLATGQLLSTGPHIPSSFMRLREAPSDERQSPAAWTVSLYLVNESVGVPVVLAGDGGTVSADEVRAWIREGIKVRPIRLPQLSKAEATDLLFFASFFGPEPTIQIAGLTDDTLIGRMVEADPLVACGLTVDSSQGSVSGGFAIGPDHDEDLPVVIRRWYEYGSPRLSALQLSWSVAPDGDGRLDLEPPRWQLDDSGQPNH